MNFNEIADCVMRSAEGDTEAFEKLYKLTNRRIYFICLMLAVTAVSTISASAAEIEANPAQAVTELQANGYNNPENITNKDLAWKFAKESGDYWYNVKSDDTTKAVIVAYVGKDTEVTIPDTINGLTVAEIGSDAFSKTDRNEK